MATSLNGHGQQLSDLKLLEIQAKMGLDEHGRIPGKWCVKVTAAHKGHQLFLGSALSQPLANALRTTFDATSHGPDPTTASLALRQCEQILNDANGPVSCTSGPSYLVSTDTHATSSAKLVLSQSQQLETVRQNNPGNWLPQEWDELINGRLGPWAMATIGKRVVSICHTPKKMTDDAAECGVWTDPDFRGQGHAAATTAAWASILKPTRRHLFYSTDAKNRSSQSVAARLKLRPIGSVWVLSKQHDDT